MKKKKRGFTLLEVLVVVLIIGILAAVALPMYKHTVIKSRFSTVMPIAKAVADAQEVYYLANGQYARTKGNLDVASEAVTNTEVSLSTAEEGENYNYVAAYHTDFPDARYIMYQKHSPKFAGNIHCEAKADDNDALWLCEKGLHGQFLAGSVKGSGYKTYTLTGNSTDTFCPTGATCDSNTGAVTGCNSAYYLYGGSCSERGDYNYAGTDTCEDWNMDPSQSTCQGKTYGDYAYASGVYGDHSTFEGNARAGAMVCSLCTFHDNSQCIGGCGETSYFDNAVCTGMDCGYLSAYHDNAVCEGFAGSGRGCETAVYVDNACCASDSCAGQHIRKCVKNSDGTYKRVGYWDD